MSDPVLTLRVPPDLRQRVDSLVPKIESVPHIRAAGRVSRSSVFRMAVLKGVEALEREYGAVARINSIAVEEKRADELEQDLLRRRQSAQRRRVQQGLAVDREQGQRTQHNKRPEAIVEDAGSMIWDE